MNITTQRILDQLRECSGTVPELALRIPASPRNVLTHIKKLHGNGVYICGWRRGKSGPISAIYKVGDRPDAARPVPLSASTICSRYRKRLRAKFGEHYGAVHALQKKRIPGRTLLIDGRVAYQQ